MDVLQYFDYRPALGQDADAPLTDQGFDVGLEILELPFDHRQLRLQHHHRHETCQVWRESRQVSDFLEGEKAGEATIGSPRHTQHGAVLAESRPVFGQEPQRLLGQTHQAAAQIRTDRLEHRQRHEGGAHGRHDTRRSRLQTAEQPHRLRRTRHHRLTIVDRADEHRDRVRSPALTFVHGR